MEIEFHQLIPVGSLIIGLDKGNKQGWNYISNTRVFAKTQILILGALHARVRCTTHSRSTNL
jgi:hypothetical protein